ncbi:MAG TPA: glycosyltransferase family 4 protein [Thermoplasmata archaeon]|nr:glycosyltransferase family 4 protein [Thermoplasmata archaeon]
MRIAELSTRYPPGPGGVERHVGEVARRLAARGESVGAFSTDLYREFPWQRLEPSVPRRETVDGVGIRRLRAWTLPGELHYPFFRGLPAALREFDPEILHVHTYGTHHATVARRYRRGRGTPYVLTAHFHPIWSIHGGWLRHRIRGFYDRRLAGAVLRDASAVVVQTREEHRLLEQLGLPLPRVELVPPGYSPLPPPRPGGPTFAERWGIPGPFVLFVGRLASNKGLLELVEAFRILASEEPEATLVLVGEDGGMRTVVEERVRALGLAPRVRITGFIADEELLAAGFREARIFALPSEYEAFGLVLLEALAQSTAVVATAVGGMPEVLEGGRAGRLVPPGDIPALARAFTELYRDGTERTRLGEFGRREVVPRYDWESVVTRLQTIFREVVGARRTT